MAYSALPVKVAGDTITLTNWNNLRDNFAAGVPDIFTTLGDLAVATAADTATRLAAGADGCELNADSGEATGLKWQIKPACRVYSSVDGDPTPDTWSVLGFDSERYDTDAMHNVAVNNSRLTIPTGGDGLYHIWGGVAFDFSTLPGFNTIGLRILLNGTDVIGQTTLYVPDSGGVYVLQVVCDYELAATNYLQLQAYTFDDIDVLALGNYSIEFSAHWFRG